MSHFRRDVFHRILWWNPCSNDLENVYRLDRMVEVSARAKATLIHFPATGSTIPYTHQAFYNSRVMPKADFLGTRDLVAEAIEACSRHGIGVVLYFNGHWYSDEFLRRHPDWAVVNANGKPHSLGFAYGGGGSPCPASEPFREFTRAFVEEVTTNYHLAGLFLDGPVYFPESCYCAHCLRRFRGLHGEDPPRKPDWGSPLWHAFIDFRYQMLEEYLSLVRQSSRKDIPIYKNAAVLTATWFGCHDVERLRAHEDLIGAEHFVFYVPPVEVPYWGAGANARYQSSVGAGKPASVFLCYGHKRWDYHTLPPAEMRRLIMNTAMNGAYPFVTIDDHQITEDPAQLTPIEEAFQAVASHDELFRLPSAADVALAWSGRSADYYASARLSGASGSHHYVTEARREYEPEFRGFYQLLLEAGLPFDVVGEVNINADDLGRYRALVLPNFACMDERAAGVIRDWVAQGGTLLATMETSLYTRDGQRRSDFLLADLFECHSREENIHTDSFGYQRLAEPPAGSGSLIPVFGERIAVTIPPEDSEIIARAEAPLPFRYAPLGGVTDEATIWKRRHGEGTVIHANGNLGAMYLKYHFRGYRQVVLQQLSALNSFRFRIRNAPMAELACRGAEDRIILFLCNHTAATPRPVEAFVPLHDIEIDCYQAIAVAVDVTTGQALRVNACEGAWRIHLPTLHEWAAIEVRTT